MSRGAVSTVHAVQDVLNNYQGPAVNTVATFKDHKAVNPQLQAGSAIGAMKESGRGLSHIQDVKTALTNQIDQAKTGSDLSSSSVSRGPDIFREGAQAGALGMIGAVFPKLAGMVAAAGLAGAVAGGFQAGPQSAVNNVEYARSTFKSYDRKGEEVPVNASYEDAMGGHWDAAGYRTQAPLATAMPQQAHLIQAAHDTVQKFGAKKIEEDLQHASITEQKLQGQMGATMQFVEKGFAGGPKPPTHVPGFGVGFG